MTNPLAEDLERILSHDPPMWEELRGSHLFMTGGTGFFGCWFLETIAWANEHRRLNLRATILSRDPERFRLKAPWLAGNPAFQFLRGDVRTFTFPEGRFSHVIHAAAEASAQLNDNAPSVMLDTIMQGTRRCLEFARSCGARKFLFTSSGAVYGPQPSGLSHVPETFTGGPDPLDPRSAYAEGKRAAELECVLSAGRGLEIKIARCFAFAGPYMSLNAHFAIGNFIRDQLRGGPIRVQGDGRPVRSYMYARDLMVWLWTILLRGQSGRAYNVGSEEAVSIAQVAQQVAEALSPRVEVEIAGHPNRAGAASQYVPATALAREELGLQCTVPLREAIQRTHAWFLLPNPNVAPASRSGGQRYETTTPAARRPCPVCDSRQTGHLHTVRFAPSATATETQEVLGCGVCGFVFADTGQSQADYNRLYAEASKYNDAASATGSGDSPGDAARLRATAAQISEFLPSRSARILDVGCATGGLLQELAARGYANLSGMDPSSQCAEAVRRRGFRAYTGLLSAPAPGMGPYDCLVLCHVLEHVYDLAAALSGARSLLQPGALLYAETPDASRYANYLYAPFQEFNTEHINHFSLVALSNLAQRYGFVTVHAGAKIFPVGPAMDYPAIFGIFQMKEVPAKWTPRPDPQLRPDIERYIAESTRLLNQIDDVLREILQGVPEIIVWGTGQLAMKLFMLPSLAGAKVIACTDSNPMCHGKTLAGVRIVPPQELRGMTQPILITSILHRDAIARKIRSDGLTNELMVLPDAVAQLLTKER